MNKQEITKTEKKNETLPKAFFVEADKLIDRMKELTETISHRAFEIFNEGGRKFGRDLEHWLRAESEVLRRVPVEITEKNGQIMVHAEVPGFKANEIKISVEQNNLIISGKTEKKSKTEKEKTVYSEWRANEFMRKFELLTPVDPTKAHASLHDGILTLTLPKAEVKEAKQIKVKTA